MEMQEEVRRIRCGSGNCYLVSNGEDAVLVDTARKKYRNKILRACRPFRVRLIVLTHGHIDHVQNAAFLSRELHAPVALSERDADLLRDNLAQPLEAETLSGRLVLAASAALLRSMDFEPFVPDVCLADGDALDEYGISARIVFVPGHTDGSVAVDVAERHLFVGDALMNFLRPTVSLLYHDKSAMLESAEKISGLGSRKIYFGHGSPVQNREWTRR
ncbi:MAG: MBL fold metallo-hydrolase [Treponemataceae bacterium]|nr:MBL fold metallo-hydrolase [Treponemataceae bacterium]